MLMVIFQIGADRYAIPCSRVVEIIPQVALKAVPQAPDHVAGLFSFRATIVPVIDLCRLAHKRPCQPFLSSRIILVHYRGGATGSNQKDHILGLLVERATEVFEKPDTGSVPPVRVADAPYLGDIYSVGGQMIQSLEPEALLPDDLRELLFTDHVTDKAVVS